MLKCNIGEIKFFIVFKYLGKNVKFIIDNLYLIFYSKGRSTRKPWFIRLVISNNTLPLPAYTSRHCRYLTYGNNCLANWSIIVYWIY